MTSRRQKLITRVFVLVAVAICLVLMAYTMRFFIDGFLGAIMFYVLFRPLMRHMTQVRKMKKGVAATLIILLSFFIIMLPVFFLASMMVPKITMLVSQGSLTMDAVQAADARIRELTGFKILTEENIAKLQDTITSFITGFLGESLNMLTDVALLYLFLYYMLINSGRLEEQLETNIPFTKEKIDHFSRELEDQTKSNAVGIPLLAICQGLFAALGYWIFGIPEPMFWGIMTGMFSLLPVIGSALIWLPAGIYLLSAGNTGQGIGVILYGIVVIGLVDNVFRLLFQKKFADIHPLITIVGVIVGLQLFGIAGLIFGPLLVSYFILLLKILREEFLVT
jgi:predicted PurR-regulated permease PerM